MQRTHPQRLRTGLDARLIALFVVTDGAAGGTSALTLLVLTDAQHYDLHELFDPETEAGAMLWAEEYQKINPGVRFDIQGGAGKGMTILGPQRVAVGGLTELCAELRPGDCTASCRCSRTSSATC